MNKTEKIDKFYFHVEVLFSFYSQKKLRWRERKIPKMIMVCQIMTNIHSL